jgi:hypothetical protein
MANPSLQIGNSNWAIKEDNLLGYSTAGTRFVPQPITMTRASAGTRVNSSGLVETVELLGSEEVTNGDFESGTSGWNASYSGTLNNTGNALNVVAVGLNNTRAATAITTVIGKTYKYVTDITQIQSTLTSLAVSNNYNLDGAFVNSSNITTPTNSVTVFFTATSTTTYIGFKRSGAAAVGITNIYDNVSVKEYTANNLARVDYDGTASSLLVEPERTNLITTSEDFDAYRIAGSTVTPNSTTAADGTNSGILVTQGVSTLVLRASNVVAPSTTYTFSGYFKSSSSVTQVTLDITDNGNTTFDLTSEWQRFSITAESRPGGSPYHFVDVATNGIQGDTFYAWGLQVEEGSYPTSYIPTDGGTVTRVQDQYSKTGISNLINSEEGVLFAEMAALSNDATSRLISLSDGTNTKRINIYYDTSSNSIYGLLLNSSVQGITSFTLSDSTNFAKIAFKYKENDFALWVNGTEVDTDSSGTTFTSDTLNKLSFDRADGVAPFYGKVKQLQVFKTALTDTELATLTT